EDPLVQVVSDVLGIVIVTSDGGFMGGLNKQVIEAGLRAQGDRINDKTSLVVIGDKGAGALTDRDRKFKFFKGIEKDTLYEQALEIKDYIVGEVLARRMGKVVLAYPKALSFSSQTIETINILPCAELFDMTVRSEIAERTAGSKMLAEARQVIVESSFSDMVEYLAGVWVASKLYEVFEDSKLAEFSARAMHLEGSVQKVQKEHSKIKHQVFRAVHELIDKGMRECHSAKMIKEKKKKKKKVARNIAKQALKKAGAVRAA
ncbi:MAG: F0F1 ATP synthase subunit gamma, partial [Lentisphaerae bacterium]|nr:F0F1 ATP synthase subunit gamma [Lentisphaerota bacterium]